MFASTIKSRFHSMLFTIHCVLSHTGASFHILKPRLIIILSISEDVAESEESLSHFRKFGMTFNAFFPLPCDKRCQHWSTLGAAHMMKLNLQKVSKMFNTVNPYNLGEKFDCQYSHFEISCLQCFQVSSLLTSYDFWPA